MSRLLAAACSVVAIAVASTAFAGEEQELEAARTRLASGKYEEAEARLSRMVDPKVEVCPSTPELTPAGCQITDPEMLQKARGYFVNALVANGKRDEARKPIYDIIYQDPSFAPSPTLFPQPVIDLFEEESGRHRAELAKKIQEDAAKVAKDRAEQEEQKKERNAYIAALEARASIQVVNHSRWIAAIPFGVGQYQNDSIGWGLFFTMTEVVTSVTAAVTTGVSYNLMVQGIAQEHPPTRAPALPPVNWVYLMNQPRTSPSNTIQLQVLQVVNDVSVGAFIAFALSGIIEAEVNFKPTVEIHRPDLLPPKPKVLVTGVPNAPSAYGAGLKVTF